ncbi:MAG: urea carboxylase, partial [Bryobacterales bacterium]|nr:urea carboxylase [Bryobacterales bacterium]
MFRKVLIANRGAIACRILRTLKKMGIAGVAVYSEADRHSLHVAQADEAVAIGPAPAAQSYLDIEKILDAARRTGAEAIHPGYGFLSENAGFAERCEAAGIAFIGPMPEQMRAFGLKHTARELAGVQGVPMLPGTDLLPSAEDALAAAERVGYPVILKSTAGGGGIGMRVCRGAEELAEAYAVVDRLGKANFGQSGVYLERFVEQARHVEVQIFGDGKGEIIALGERDCSAQRRNQKVIEETPAPGLRPEVREKLLASAVALGKAVSYRSAGTVEFLFDGVTQEFFFLEVNTRLQVEHGVTEEVTGIDIVELMVRQAAGELGPLAGIAVNPRGHSIQVRLYAEDPAKNFQPSSGLLSRVVLPATRCETWVETGTEVTPFYDPMLAKIIVHGATRAEAVSKMRMALEESAFDGIETNLSYLRQVCDDGKFRSGGITTAYLKTFDYHLEAVEVLEPGTQTTVQDYPGRLGYWHVGVPPSGPMDWLAFRLANRLVGNADGDAGLECTITGPSLRFHKAAVIALAGADMGATLNGAPVPRWQAVDVPEGAVLRMGAVQGAGARAYVAVRGGLDVPEYLGSRAT